MRNYFRQHASHSAGLSHDFEIRGIDLTYADTLQALAIAVSAKIPVILWGPPGQGKSAAIRELATQTGRHLETVISSVREPSDFVGIPYVVNGTTSFVPPDWAVRLAGASAGLLFFDEISTAPPSTQAALLRVVLERVAGDLYLGDETSIVAAANPPHQSADGWDLSLPMANRFCHLEWELPSDIVRQGFSTGWPSARIIDSEKFNVAGKIDSDTGTARLLIGAFLGARPDLVTVVPESSSDGGRAFPTPRSWDMAAQALGYCTTLEVEPNVKRLLVNGILGVGAASELLHYLENLDLPDPEEVLAKPDDFDVPVQADKVFAVGASLLNSVKRDNSGERWHSAGAALARIAESGNADIAVLLARRWLELKPSEVTRPDSQTLKALAPVLRAAGAIE